MGTQGYTVVSHQAAQNELAQLPNPDRDTLKNILIELSTLEQPTEHSKANPLRDTDNFFRVRSGDYRVICSLDLPHLKVLKVDQRDEHTYTKGLNEARERATDSL